MGGILLFLGLVLLGYAPRPVGAAPDGPVDAPGVLRHALAAACDAADMGPRDPGWRLGQATLVEESVFDLGGRPGRLRRLFRLPSGDELRMRLFFPGGRLRRAGADIYQATGGGATRPVMTATAGGDCRIAGGRRILYDSRGQATELVFLGPDLEDTGRSEPLNAPVPAGADPGGVTVAHVDSGINYTIPALAARLARDPAGRALGYDYWDMDDRPFDADTGRSPFFPIRHGTRVAGILVREAPDVRLLPYRYPRPAMGRMADMVADADANGALIVAMPMGSNDPGAWRPFAEAAGSRPHRLVVVSAGTGRQHIDAEPVYPAVLGLESRLVVTSSDATGRLAPGSNWGAEHVDVMVDAENLDTIDHRGARTKVSGSSFAVPRVAALAARLAKKHPTWRAAELKKAILARARPPPFHRTPVVRHGWIPYPQEDG